MCKVRAMRHVAGPPWTPRTFPLVARVFFRTFCHEIWVLFARRGDFPQTLAWPRGQRAAASAALAEAGPGGARRPNLSRRVDCKHAGQGRQGVRSVHPGHGRHGQTQCRTAFPKSVARVPGTRPVRRTFRNRPFLALGVLVQFSPPSMLGGLRLYTWLEQA